MERTRLVNLVCMVTLAAGLGAGMALAHDEAENDWPRVHRHWHEGIMMQPGYMMNQGYRMSPDQMPYQGHGMNRGHMMGQGYEMRPGTMMDDDDHFEHMHGRQPLREDLEVDDVRHMMEHRLEWMNNPNIRLGDVTEDDDDTISAEIVTKDGSLVQRMHVDRHTGMMRTDH